MILTRSQIRLIRGYDHGSGSFDRRNILTINYIYNFPGFNQSSKMAARMALGGWQFSGVTVCSIGNAAIYNYTGATDTLGLGGGILRIVRIWWRPSPIRRNGLHGLTPLFCKSDAALAAGPNQGFGTAGKDVVVAPGLFNFNWSLFKNIPFTEGA